MLAAKMPPTGGSPRIRPVSANAKAINSQNEYYPFARKKFEWTIMNSGLAWYAA
jgi:hypothetical protein